MQNQQSHIHSSYAIINLSRAVYGRCSNAGVVVCTVEPLLLEGTPRLSIMNTDLLDPTYNPHNV